jgi:hypothetical protein
VCDPATVLLVTSAALTIGGQAESYVAGKKASDTNKRNADLGLGVSLNTIATRKAEEADATQMTIMQADRQSQQAKAVTQLSAGEAGVSGASVDALISDISGRFGEVKTAEERNLSQKNAQLNRDASGAIVDAKNQVAGVPAPSAFATSLAIAGTGIDLANTIRKRKPPKNGPSNG